MSKKVRLHKYIANCGYTSRRRAELLVQGGCVEVNGERIVSVGYQIDPARDQVVVNGDPVKPPERWTILLNKPAGIITSTHDTHDRLTVMDVLPKRFRELGVFPVGRLDQDTVGLLVLTNDGDLHHRVAHPRHEIDKEYVAFVEGVPGPEALRRFESGVVIESVKTAPARVLEVEPIEDGARVRVVIAEGRKRQVRRMFEALGHRVRRLARTRVGQLELGDLPEGKWRRLDAEEIRALLKQGMDLTAR
jgi:pseudouridine synthase